MHKIINRLNLNSPNIFLLDAIGALLSLIGTVICLFISEEQFNNPLDSHAYLVSSFFLALYSAHSFRLNLPLRPFLRILIIANSIYLAFLVNINIAFSASTPTPIAYYFYIDAIVLFLVIILEVFILKMNIRNAQKGKSI